MQTVLDVHWFNWNDIERNGLWNFNHTNFKILAQKWHWNYAKTVSQLIEIKFSKSLRDYRIFFGRNVHFLYFIYHFLCTLNFWVLLFFLLFSNTLKIKNPEFQNFPVSKSIAIRKNNKHVFRKQRNPNRKEKQNYELAKT